MKLCTVFKIELYVLLFCSQWDLVCSRIPLRSTVQMAVALGKFLGALIFGFVADKYSIKMFICNSDQFKCL
jgi:hypothetical protein